MTSGNEKKKTRKITPIKMPTQARSKDKVNKIMQSAKSLLAFKGVEKLTTNHIAEHAGVSVGSIYQYFPNKQAIICQIYFEWLNEVRSGIESFKEISKEMDFSTLSDQLFEVVYGDFARNPAIEKLETELNKAMTLYPELQEIDDEHSKAMVSLLAEIVQNVHPDCDAVKAQQLGMFLYSLDSSFQQFIYLGGDRELALNWYRKTAKNILEY